MIYQINPKINYMKKTKTNPKLQGQVIKPEITEKSQQRQSSRLKNQQGKDYKTFIHSLKY